MVRTAWRCTGLAAALVVALLAPADRAQAGVRVTVTYDPGGANLVKYFYDPTETSLITGLFTLGQFSGTIGTTVSNYPGTSGIGTLSQTLIISAVTGTPSPSLALSSFAEIVDDVVGLVAGEVTGGSIASLLAAPTATWIVPDTPFLLVTADVSASTAVATVGTVTTDTIINGGPPISSGAVSVNPGGAFTTSGLVANPPPPGYTLSQRVTVTGLSVGITSFPLTGSSSVIPTPAPGAFLLCAAGAPMLGLGWFRRRRNAA